MILQSPGAILVKVGFLTIRWYGLMIALGFLMAARCASSMSKRWGIDSEKLLNCALFSFIGGIIGARLYFVALSWNYFSIHLTQIAQLWQGGLSIHGGIIAGLLVGIIYAKLNKLPILTTADIFGSTIALGQAIGRWGNFFNCEAFGKPTTADFPIKLYIPFQDRPTGYQNVDFFHPTFLYESMWDFTLFALLYFYLADRLKKFPGVTFVLYLTLYSAGRSIIETLRTDSIMFHDIPVPIIACIVTLVLCLIALLGLFYKYKLKK